MAGNVYGADVAELRLLGEKLARSADDLDRIANLLTHQITSTTAWVGPSAQKFRGEWSGSHRGAVATSARALRDCAAALRRNADEQDRTSAVDSSSAGLPVAARSSGGDGFGLDQHSVDWIRTTGLPGLEKTYDLLAKAEGYIGTAAFLMKPILMDRIPFVSLVMAGHDLAASGPQTMSDLASGNIWREGKAIFRTGWTVAKVIPVVGAVDFAANLGVDIGKGIADGVMGPGTSDRAFNDVGQQIDKAGNDFNAAGATAGAWIADRITQGVKGVFHF